MLLGAQLGRQLKVSPETDEMAPKRSIPKPGSADVVPKDECTGDKDEISHSTKRAESSK